MTGDVNSGKSTFVNLIIGQSIVPVDEQPCTQAFCEISFDTRSESSQIDQFTVHAISNIVEYDPSNNSSYKIVLLNELNNLLQDENDCHIYYRIYRRHNLSSELSSSIDQISIIDSPGLNCDVLKTTALFAKQEDIDVIVIILNASNHLTLSAKEFLQSAAIEKLHIFVIVNKIDLIVDIKRCKERVLKQIKELLPETYLNSDSLIHFTSLSSKMVDNNRGFSSLQQIRRAIQDFAVKNRIISKLLPIKNYIYNSLLEIEKIIEHTLYFYKQQSCNCKDEMLNISLPYEELLKLDPILRQKIDKIIERWSVNFINESKAISLEFANIPKKCIDSVKWKGLFYFSNFRCKLNDKIQQELIDFSKRLNSASHSLFIDCSSEIKKCLSDLTHLFDYEAPPTQIFEWSSSSYSLPRLENLTIKLPYLLYRIFPRKLFTFASSVIFGYFSSKRSFHYVSFLTPWLNLPAVLSITTVSLLFTSIFNFVNFEKTVKDVVFDALDASFKKNLLIDTLVSNAHSEFRLKTFSLASDIYSRYSQKIAHIKNEIEKTKQTKRRFDSIIFQIGEFYNRELALKNSLDSFTIKSI